jgi:hypothetical protein
MYRDFCGKESAMRKDQDKNRNQKTLAEERPNFTKPVWGSLEMSCEECNYNTQDIDTFPCAKCHTRH